MIKWESKLSVKVKEIDEQHRQFIDILNRLGDMVNARDLPERMGLVLQELTEYAEKHFATEEGYFDKFSYEGIEEHKKAHQELKASIAGFVEKRNDPAKDVYETYLELLDFLADWLVNHLEDMDMKYVKCFNDHGLF